MTDEFLASIEKKIPATKNDIFELVKFNHVFHETWKIIQANPLISIDNDEDLYQPDNRLFSYLMNTYVQYVTTSIRRHSRLNKSNDKSSSRSLIYLLNKLKNNHKYLKREYYVEKILVKYQNFTEFNETLFRHEANTHFDALTSRTEQNALCLEIIENDTINLEDITKPICDFVDKNIAHLEANTLNKNLSLENILDSVNILSILTDKYLMIFKDEALSPSKLKYEGWKNCFKHAWVQG